MTIHLIAIHYNKPLNKNPAYDVVMDTLKIRKVKKDSLGGQKNLGRFSKRFLRSIIDDKIP